LNIDTVDGDPNLKKRMVRIDPQDLIGRTFLKKQRKMVNGLELVLSVLLLRRMMS
jgi:hypothetical protein